MRLFVGALVILVVASACAEGSDTAVTDPILSPTTAPTATAAVTITTIHPTTTAPTTTGVSATTTTTTRPPPAATWQIPDKIADRIVLEELPLEDPGLSSVWRFVREHRTDEGSPKVVALLDTQRSLLAASRLFGLPNTTLVVDLSDSVLLLVADTGSSWCWPLWSDLEVVEGQVELAYRTDLYRECTSDDPARVVLFRLERTAFAETPYTATVVNGTEAVNVGYIDGFADWIEFWADGGRDEPVTTTVALTTVVPTTTTVVPTTITVVPTTITVVPTMTTVVPTTTTVVPTTTTVVPTTTTVVPTTTTVVPTTTTTIPPVAEVGIAGFSFGAPVQVSVGQTIRFNNLDGASHTATANLGAFDTGSIGGGQSTEIVIDAPGTYAYFCSFHPYMTSTITVLEG